MQTSACGTPLWVPESVGVGHSVLHVQRTAVIHTPTRTVSFDISDVPYCTFDYRAFCEGLLAQTDAEVLRAPVRRIGDGAVETHDGRFEGRCIVDCSGWRGYRLRGHAAGAALSFALETVVDHRDDALHFWFAAAPPRHVIRWIFPVGPAVRVGVGSYVGDSKLKAPLGAFMDERAMTGTTYHGTYFPSELGAPTDGTVFVVGDAAGQCLPATAEGIRPAVSFGDRCGVLVQRVIDGDVTLVDALATYRRTVLAHRAAYRHLRWAQSALQHLPRRGLGAMADVLRSTQHRWWPRYANFGQFDLGGARRTPQAPPLRGPA